MSSKDRLRTPFRSRSSPSLLRSKDTSPIEFNPQSLNSSITFGGRSNSVESRRIYRSTSGTTTPNKSNVFASLKLDISNPIPSPLSARKPSGTTRTKVNILKGEK